jgi:protein-S-isoprenylcysteine O-methyltransferase Ste14
MLKPTGTAPSKKENYHKNSTFFIKQLDATVYGFVGPFGVLYVFPQFFRGLDKKLGLVFPVSHTQDFVGSTIMWLGAALAIWCGGIMLYNKTTISAFSKATQLTSRGPYRFVRHPMMWAIHITLMGEVIANNSPMILFWFLLWTRLAMIWVRYEEFRLHILLGKQYEDYCNSTPRWFPKFNF